MRKTATATMWICQWPRTNCVFHSPQEVGAKAKSVCLKPTYLIWIFNHLVIRTKYHYMTSITILIFGRVKFFDTIVVIVYWHHAFTFMPVKCFFGHNQLFWLIAVGKSGGERAIGRQIKRHSCSCSASFATECNFSIRRIWRPWVKMAWWTCCSSHRWIKLLWNLIAK